MNTIHTIILPAMGIGLILLSATSGAQETALLQSPSPNAGDEFGFASAIEGKQIVIGAPGMDNNHGGAFVLDCQQTPCARQRLIQPSDFDDDDVPRFGYAVAMAGNLAAVSAPFHNIETRSGAVYVYQKRTTGWHLIQQILPAKEYVQSNANFGYALSMKRFFSNDLVPVESIVLAVGAPGQNENLGGIFVYKFVNTAFVPMGNVVNGGNNHPGARFGESLSLSADTTLLVGAPMERDFSPARFGNGVAYTFSINPFNFVQPTQISRITLSGGTNAMRFGHSVSIDNGHIAIGAPFSQDRGRVYVFDWNGSAATLINTLGLAEGEQRDQLGWSVDVKGNSLLIGAPLADLTADALDTRCGAAYQSQFAAATWSVPRAIQTSIAQSNSLQAWQVLQSAEGRLLSAPQWNAASSNNVGAVAWFDTSDNVFKDGLESVACAVPAG